MSKLENEVPFGDITETESCTEKTERIFNTYGDYKFDIVLDIVKVHTHEEVGE